MGSKNILAVTSTNPAPSDKTFGWFFAGVFMVVAIYSYQNQWRGVAASVATVAVCLAVISLVYPRLLSTPNGYWHRLGLLLGRIVSPLTLGVIFFGMITPVSLITRLFGRDELRLKKGIEESFWVDRTAPGQSSDSFKNQY